MKASDTMLPRLGGGWVEIQMKPGWQRVDNYWAGEHVHMGLLCKFSPLLYVFEIFHNRTRRGKKGLIIIYSFL